MNDTLFWLLWSLFILLVLLFVNWKAYRKAKMTLKTLEDRRAKLAFETDAAIEINRVCIYDGRGQPYVWLRPLFFHD